MRSGEPCRLNILTQRFRRIALAFAELISQSWQRIIPTPTPRRTPSGTSTDFPLISTGRRAPPALQIRGPPSSQAVGRRINVSSLRGKVWQKEQVGEGCRHLCPGSDSHSQRLYFAGQSIACGRSGHLPIFSRQTSLPVRRGHSSRSRGRSDPAKGRHSCATSMLSTLHNLRRQ